MRQFCDMGAELRWLWFGLGLLFLALGLIGAVLPLLPTTPFLLVATAAFAKSSPRLHAWIMQHPTFGPPIRNWQENRAISTKAKNLAIGTMGAALLLSLIMGAPWMVIGVQALVMGMGSCFILTRPTGASAAEAKESPPVEKV